jgi:hypothetical protein
MILEEAGMSLLLVQPELELKTQQQQRQLDYFWFE